MLYDLASVMYSIQHYVIKIVSNLQQAGSFFPGIPVSLYSLGISHIFKLPTLCSIE